MSHAQIQEIEHDLLDMFFNGQDCYSSVILQQNN